MPPPLRIGTLLLVDSTGHFDVLGGPKLDPGHHHLLCEQVGRHELNGEIQAHVALFAFEFVSTHLLTKEMVMPTTSL